MCKYIECDHCHSKIKFGDKVYHNGVHCAIFCSPLCYCKWYAKEELLDEDVVEDHRCTVYTENK